LLKINYQNPYIEYIIESYYIEDVLKPLLNVFVSRIINPYNITTNTFYVTFPALMYHMNYHFASYKDFENFLNRIDKHEAHLLFMLKKHNQ
jgi:hypothetical protein